MRIWNSFKVAFSMYSKIPMGRTEWNEDNMKYSMCFVPLIGFVIGIAEILWFWVSIKLQFNDVIRACIATILPMLVTGGIHMDGYCDVIDALSSYGDKEKKLAILKDPHVGAFAIMWTSVYFVVLVGLFSQIRTESPVTMMALIFVLSRAVTCLLSIFLKNARKKGTLYAFSSRQEKGTVSVVLMIYIIAAITAMVMVCWQIAIVVGIAVLVVVLWFCRMIYRNFGGITGDMAGFLIQILELVSLGSIVLGEAILHWVI